MSIIQFVLVNTRIICVEILHRYDSAKLRFQTNSDGRFHNVNTAENRRRIFRPLALPFYNITKILFNVVVWN